MAVVRSVAGFAYRDVVARLRAHRWAAMTAPTVYGSSCPGLLKLVPIPSCARGLHGNSSRILSSRRQRCLPARRRVSTTSPDLWSPHFTVRGNRRAEEVREVAPRAHLDVVLFSALEERPSAFVAANIARLRHELRPVGSPRRVDLSAIRHHRQDEAPGRGQEAHSALQGGSRRSRMWSCCERPLPRKRHGSSPSRGLLVSRARLGPAGGNTRAQRHFVKRRPVHPTRDSEF